MALFSMFALASLQGCAAARSAGGEFASGAIARLEASDSAMIGLQRQFVDSAGALLDAEFARAVLEPARTTWSQMRQGVREEGDSLAARFDAMLREAVEETLPSGVDRSAEALEQRLGGLGRTFAEQFSLALGDGVSTHLQPAADSLFASMIRTAVLGLETDLRPAVHALMLDLRDSLEVRIGDVDRALAGSQTVNEMRYALFGAGGMLLLASVFFGAGMWRRKSRALDAMIDAIEHGGDEKTKLAVETCAHEAGVQSWLGGRIRERTRNMLQARPDKSEAVNDHE
jgi:hypothetical protein